MPAFDEYFDNKLENILTKGKGEFDKKLKRIFGQGDSCDAFIDNRVGMDIKSEFPPSAQPFPSFRM